jgi:Large ribosomal RNA subunit accumulation protein YceD
VSQAPPEFSRRIQLARLGAHETAYPISAEAAEREALARRFDLLSLDRLEAEIHLQRVGGGMVRLSGRLSADVVQACVVSLEPVASVIEQDFAMLYGPTEPGKSVMVDLEADVPEPFEGDAIDIGEAAAQQLALALDPYPRAPGASLEWGGDAGQPARKPQVGD